LPLVLWFKVEDKLETEGGIKVKSKLVLVCIMVVIALGLFACSSEPTPSASVECSYAWNQTTEVAIGDTLTVTLESNPTTGFEWMLVGITDETVLEEEGHEFVTPEAEAPPGTGGEEVWTFKALKEGKSTIGMEYRRPWEEGVEPDKVFALIVVVK